METVLIVLAVLILLPIVKRLLVFGLARLIGRAIGQAALNQQPDEISLSPTGKNAWKKANDANHLAESLLTRGFRDAGVFRIEEMPGVVVQLLAKPEECFYAAVYEHPQVGCWIDIATRYTNGDGSTFTTSKPTGLAPRPGHPMVHSPGTGPLALYARARAERARGEMHPATVEHAVEDFEASYAESTAWRKAKGISACEVAEVAKAA
jgi:hypothetical protein